MAPGTWGGWRHANPRALCHHTPQPFHHCPPRLRLVHGSSWSRVLDETPLLLEGGEHHPRSSKRSVHWNGQTPAWRFRHLCSAAVPNAPRQEGAPVWALVQNKHGSKYARLGDARQGGGVMGGAFFRCIPFAKLS
ncbi:MAG: hypothetical protein Kow0054_26650 [Deferrisoma sp.]